MSKIGIYFSMLGNNAKIASIMAEAEHYDLIEFSPGSMLRVFQFFFGKKRLAKKARLLQGQIDAMDYIVMHGPIWGGKPAPAVMKLLENLDFNQKSVSCHFTYTQNYGETEKLVNNLIINKGGMVNIIEFHKISKERARK